MATRECPTDPPEPTWLDEDEQGSWRRYLLGTMLLSEQLDRDLRADHHISHAEYEVLVHLSEAAGHTLRMAELADVANQSRSRLSHTVDRMERDGLVARHICDADKRGIWASLTDEGMERLRKAARTHVAGVREYLVDSVDPADLAVLGRVFQVIIDRFRPDLTPSQHSGSREPASRT